MLFLFLFVVTVYETKVKFLKGLCDVLTDIICTEHIHLSLVFFFLHLLCSPQICSGSM